MKRRRLLRLPLALPAVSAAMAQTSSGPRQGTPALTGGDLGRSAAERFVAPAGALSTAGWCGTINRPLGTPASSG